MNEKMHQTRLKKHFNNTCRDPSLFYYICSVTRINPPKKHNTKTTQYHNIIILRQYLILETMSIVKLILFAGFVWLCPAISF